MSLHIAVEDQSGDDELEGLFACERCGTPTWYTLCDSCHGPDDCGHGDEWRSKDGCEARGCVG